MNPLTFLTGVRNAAISCLVCLAVGFGAGWHVKGVFQDAKEVRQVQQAQKQTASNVVTSNQTSQAIEKKAAAKAATVDAVKSAVAQRIDKQQEKTHEAKPQSLECPAPVLDAGTVRMLNDAIEGAAVDPAAVGDAEVQAPAEAAGR